MKQSSYTPPKIKSQNLELDVVRIGINTHNEPIVYLHSHCTICHSEGFSALSRVKITINKKSIIGTLNIVHSDLLKSNEIGLSDYAWNLLALDNHSKATISYAKPLDSIGLIRSKLFGHHLDAKAFEHIVSDIVHGRYNNLHLAAFISACTSHPLSNQEMADFTYAMVNAGDKISWPFDIVVDKHCIGGLPGNRTTPIIVPIVAHYGLKMPKTSSRAITSPAGTADTMEVVTNVNLTTEELKKVVQEQGACIAWGGSVNLSPADDLLIKVERALDIDSEGQMVPSILSKKLAAGATHVLIDIPVGPTAKARSQQFAKSLTEKLKVLGKKIGLVIEVVISDGTQPIGFGIGPVLEMEDILSVLQNKPNAPADLKEKSLQLAGKLLEIGKAAPPEKGYEYALNAIKEGHAFEKFKAICEAQGEFRPIRARGKYEYRVNASRAGIITYINNRFLAKIARLAGAPEAKGAGVLIQVKLGDKIDVDSPLFTIYSEASGELNYALAFLKQHPNEIHIEDEMV